MDKLATIGTSALITGTVASVVSTAALALIARAEGKRAFQPTGSTSHWLYGEDAAHGRPTAGQLLVGYLTHHASAVFWAVPFEIWLANRPPRTETQLLRDATVVSGIAAAVDYGPTPRRFTPGWELVLSRRSMVATYAAMALGLAAGAALAQYWRTGRPDFPETRSARLTTRPAQPMPVPQRVIEGVNLWP